MENNTANKLLYFASKLHLPCETKGLESNTVNVSILERLYKFPDFYCVVRLRDIGSATEDELRELATYCQWDERLIHYGRTIVELFDNDVDLKLNPPTILMTVAELVKAADWLRRNGFHIPAEDYALKHVWAKY
jgi:hypothetical protein